MHKNVFIFTPNSLKAGKSGYLKGAHHEFDDCEAFYLTSKNVSAQNGPSEQFVGYVGNAEKCKIKCSKVVQFDNTNLRPQLLNYANTNNLNLVKITYDYDAFKNSDVVDSDEEYYGLHFKNLSENLRKRQSIGGTNGQKGLFLLFLAMVAALLTRALRLLDRIQHVVIYSATLSHFQDSLTTLKWTLVEISEKRKLTPKIGNIVVSKLLDLVIGIILLNYFLQYESVIVKSIEEFREITIHNLRSLLTYLMGAPIGLKLNYAFNKSLATFFFYHVILWRIFLHALQPIIAGYFLYFVLPGALGFSFQMAMLSDVMAIATFHIYCVHVYAARLIHLQLKGLSSLWRLFIGRKHNPLRQRVDSYQYSQHQLFIGTLGFTVLLFLLPTTTVYYIVFTIFRLGIILGDEVLSRIRHHLNCLPIYVTILWACKSSNVAGTLYLKWQKNKDDIADFEAHLNTLPLLQSIQKFNPEIVKPVVPLSWSKIFTRIIVDEASS